MVKLSALSVIAVLTALVGLLLLSQATIGVGVLAFACLLGILARIAQADRQHAALIARMGSASGAVGADAAGVVTHADGTRTKPCPYCQEPNRIFAEKCGKCGVALK